MKIIPKTKNTPVVKKISENKKIVQFQTKPMPKKGKFGSSIKFDNEPEDKNSFKNAKQRSSVRPISPKGPNNQQSPFTAAQDGPHPKPLEPVVLT